MRKWLLITTIFYTIITAAAYLQAAENEYTAGTITLSPPERYIVANDTALKKKRIYNEAEFEKIDKKNIEMLDTVTIKEIEYVYKPVTSSDGFVSQEFELLEIKDGKATLRKEHIETPPEPEEYDEPEIEEELALEEAVVEEAPQEAESEASTSSILLAELFFKIETEQISEDEWEVRLPTILEAAANFSGVLELVIKKIEGLVDPEINSRIYFKSSLGKVSIGPEGMTIEDINSRLGKKLGLQDGDLIRALNGRNVTTIYDIAALFSTFTGGPQTATVTIEIDDEELVQTYYIR